MKQTYALKPEFEPLPPRLAKLPVDARGYPVPWFVEWIDGPDGPRTVPEFRAMDRSKFARAIKEKLCWVCGEPLGAWLAFQVGPMCAVNRTTAEPPCHRDCAEWSIRHCPFLSQPQMARRHDGLPSDVESPGGHHLMRNPGATCLWITRSYEVFQSDPGKYLITMGAPHTVTWWAKGRTATREEVLESIESGMPALLAAARVDGPFAVQMLGRSMEKLQPWLPSETPQ